MKNLIINTESELKVFLSENRSKLTSINNIGCNELYPIINISKKHASYYNVDKQSNIALNAPFNITIK